MGLKMGRASPFTGSGSGNAIIDGHLPARRVSSIDPANTLRSDSCKVTLSDLFRSEWNNSTAYWSIGMLNEVTG